MMKTNCKTYFSITGNFKVEEISAFLDLRHTSGHNIGDKKKYLKETYDYTEWVFGTEASETLYGNEQASHIIKILLSKLDLLLKVKEKYDCSFLLMQVPIIEEGYCPALGFDKDIIDFCYRTGTEIEIDLYANPYINKF